MQQDQASSSSSTIHFGGRAIDRHNPIIRDTKRLTRAIPSAAPCSSETPPVNPKPYNQLQKANNNKNISSSNDKKSFNDRKKKSSSSNSNPLKEKTNKILSSSNNGLTLYKDCYTAMPADVKKKSLAQLGDFITPPGSSRYLLSDPPFFDGLSDYDPVWTLVPEAEPQKTLDLSNGDDSSVEKSSSSRSEKPPSNQVVVLRVSLHCKGCEGKVKKQLSRMKGVTSFNIDFAAKKVTVVGDVTPVSVLASISKVKNAKFWPVAAAATSSASASTAVPGNIKIEINK